jgi:site-specific recombinase XerD
MVAYYILLKKMKNYFKILTRKMLSKDNPFLILLLPSIGKKIPRKETLIK